MMRALPLYVMAPEASFVALCEGFLGMSPHFDFWRHIFTINL